jgi:hypothetical protein
LQDLGITLPVTAAAGNPQNQIKTTVSITLEIQ